MATNVYRAEERVFYDGENPTVYQGYTITMSGDSVTVTHNEHTWELAERLVAERFRLKQADRVFAAGFLLCAVFGPADWRDWAIKQLIEEVGEEYADDIHSADWAWWEDALAHKNVESLTVDEMRHILTEIRHAMYAERDNDAEDASEDRNVVIIRYNPDREVNGGDLVDKVGALFEIHGLVPPPINEESEGGES